MSKTKNSLKENNKDNDNNKVVEVEVEETGIQSYCDCCGRWRIVKRYNIFSDFMLCEKCKEYDD